MAIIETADPTDLAEIEAWLREEFELAGTGRGFWCNMGIINSAADKGQLSIIREHKQGRVVGFSVVGSGGGSIDIIEVHPVHRGKGYGRLLVQHCIQAAKQAGADEVEVLCEPASSIPFWQYLGFVAVESEFGARSGPTQMKLRFR
jgi:GNAT superfamily N-acetyltransferase